MADDYAPFPEVRLLEYASATPVRALAKDLRDAVDAHQALRERFFAQTISLRAAETERDQFKTLCGIDDAA